MTVNNVLLFLHIASAIIIFGGLAYSAMIVPSMVRGGRDYLPTLRKVRGLNKVFALSTAVVFLLGIGLILKNDYKFSLPWISASMLLFIVSVIISSVPYGRTLTTAISKINEGHPADAEASRLGMLGGINILILLTIVYLMVFTPGGIG